MAQSANIITTSLPAYVQENREVLIDEIVFRSPSIARMGKQTGIKKSAYLNYLDVRPVFQPGKGCGFTPQGEVELLDREIDVAEIKINMDVCPDNLRGTFAEYLIRTRAGEQPLPYEAEITNGIKNFIQEALEKAVWQGDKTSQDDNLNHFDGLLKIAGAEAGVVDVDLTGVTSMWGAIDAVIAKIPKAARKRGAKVNVGPELFEAYLQELVAANLYHYSGPQNEAPTQWIHPGTNVPVVRVEGMEETLAILATYDANLRYGTDMENDLEVFSIIYDEKEEQFHIKVKWASGVQIAFPDRVALAVLDESPVRPDPTSAIGAIAAATEDIASKMKDYSEPLGAISTGVTGLNSENKVFKVDEQGNVTSIALNKAATEIAQGSTEQLTATIAPVGAATVIWESSDETVATVSDAGLVTAVAAGTAVIIAHADDKVATCIVTVPA